MMRIVTHHKERQFFFTFSQTIYTELKVIKLFKRHITQKFSSYFVFEVLLGKRFH